MSVYAVPAEIVARGGFLDLTLRYRPHYTETTAALDHNLLYFDADNRVYYDESATKFVLRIGAAEILSSAVTFSALQEITLAIEHTADGRSLTVSGVTTGNGEATGAALDAIDLPTTAYVLGTSAGAEEDADLLALIPNLTTYAEHADDRLLLQIDDADDNRKLRELLAILTTLAARYRDVCIAVKNAFDLNGGAFGDQLDVLGSIVGLSREGFGDDRYRDFLNIQRECLLAAARDNMEWTGTCESIIRIARLFVGAAADPIALTNLHPYGYTLTVPDLVYAEAPLLARFLRIATYAGVYGVILVTLDVDSIWDSEAAVSITNAGTWQSEAVAVSGDSTWGTAVPIE